jgi:predicted RNA methylase
LHSLAGLLFGLMVAFIGHHFIFGIENNKESKLILSSNKSNNTAISVLKISVMSNDIKSRFCIMKLHTVTIE